MSTNRKKRPTSNPRSTSAINDKVKVTVSLTADAAQKVEALAKQLGVSKSELFERFAQEKLNSSPETPNTANSNPVETEPTVNIDSSTTSSETANLKQQVEEKDKIIQQLQQQVARISELEAQREKTVALETYEALRKEAEQQKITIAEFQTQLTRIPELEQQRNIQAQLNQQIEALQKELHERHRSWMQLQTKEEKIAELEGKLAHSISKENYQQLEQICATQKMQIATIEKKLASLISPIQHQDETNTTANNYDALKNYMQEQDQLINVLQKRVLELQGLASFGESQLSKWRNRTFNS